MHLILTYRSTKPSGFYQNAGINGATYASFDFGGNKTDQGYFFSSYITFKNLAGANFAYFYDPETLSSRRTRGGPLTLDPQSQSFNLNLNSDNRKPWVIFTGGNITYGDNALSKEIYANVEFKISPTFTLQLGPDFSKDKYNAQWITAYSDPTASETYEKRYLFANLDQTTFATELRADWIINPRLSFQVFMQPYFVAGKYTGFKSLNKPKSYDFMLFGEDESSIQENLTTSGEIASYIFDADGIGPSPAMTIGNPDFNYLSLRGNAVIRWEYRPGSSLYLVWTQNRQEIEPYGDFRLSRSTERIFDIKPENIFLIKLSYWF